MMTFQEEGWTPVEVPYREFSRAMKKWLSTTCLDGDHDYEEGEEIKDRRGQPFWSVPYRVWFEQPSDAVLFKLTWGGAA